MGSLTQRNYGCAVTIACDFPMLSRGQTRTCPRQTVHFTAAFCSVHGWVDADAAVVCGRFESPGPGMRSQHWCCTFLRTRGLLVRCMCRWPGNAIAKMQPIVQAPQPVCIIGIAIWPAMHRPAFERLDERLDASASWSLQFQGPVPPFADCPWAQPAALDIRYSN